MNHDFPSSPFGRLGWVLQSFQEIGASHVPPSFARSKRLGSVAIFRRVGRQMGQNPSGSDISFWRIPCDNQSWSAGKFPIYIHLYSFNTIPHPTPPLPPSGNSVLKGICIYVFSHFPAIHHSFQAFRQRHRFHRFPGLRQSWEFWQRRVSLFTRTQPIRGRAGRPGVSWGRVFMSGVMALKIQIWKWWLIVLFMVINDKW